MSALRLTDDAEADHRRSDNTFTPLIGVLPDRRVQEPRRRSHRAINACVMHRAMTRLPKAR